MSLSKAAPLAAFACLMLAACSAGDSDPESHSDGHARSSAEMEHIHGIGVDPGDGTVYVGTHYGLFRLDEDRATRVADRVQDFMGFTVAGPGHFLASGHPGEGQGGPDSVGLIESDDAGETWQGLSLSDEADFHALEYRHDRVYGLNALTGQLLVTQDMQSWAELSRIPIADFAVSPTDPDVLVATTEDGPALSVDGGRAFEPLKAAPLMVFVSWAEDGTLAGVTPEGAVYTAEDPRGGWTEGGTLAGPPEALTVQSSSELYAAASGTVLMSTDGGRTFHELPEK